MKMFYAAVTDLFFIARITESAKFSEAKVIFNGNFEELVNRIDYQMPDGLLVDLNGFLTADQLQEIKSKYNIRIIGYLSHVQTEMRKIAEEICDQVLSQAEFTKNLAQLLS